MFKLWLRRIHLLLAIFSGLFLICSSITGTLLIYAQTIQREINPDYWQVLPEERTLTYNNIIQSVEDDTQQKVTLIQPELVSNLAWQIQLANKRYVSVNPYNAKILLEYDYYSTFYGFTMAFHRWLLYQDKDGNFPFRLWVSIATLCLIIEIIVGLYLWIRPRNRIKRLKINRKAKNKILFYQLHTVLGVFLFIPLLLVAFSGIAFHWKMETSTVVEMLTLGEIEQRPDAPTIENQYSSDLQLGLALKNGLSALPQASLYRIYMAKNPSESMALRMKMPGESHAYSWVWVNPYTAKVLQVYDATKASFSTQVWNFKYKFHIGDFLSPIVQVFWIVIALSPCFFIISGVYLWFCRHRKKKT